MNETLLKRICRLIAMNYAMTEDSVWQIYNDVGSIDKAINVIQNLKNPFSQLK